MKQVGGKTAIETAMEKQAKRAPSPPPGLPPLAASAPPLQGAAAATSHATSAPVAAAAVERQAAPLQPGSYGWTSPAGRAGRPSPPVPVEQAGSPARSEATPLAPACASVHAPRAAPARTAIDEQMLTQDGLRLHLRRWPAGPDARGLVQIVHGLGEHIGRYEHVAAALNAAGWHVAGHDQRGNGRSEGPRGTIQHPLALLGDVAMVADHLRGAGGGRRVLLGHSMGGLIAARFVAENLLPGAARFARDFDALVLSSPALDIGLSKGQRLLLAVLGRLLPDLRVHNGLKPQWVSRDPAVVQAYAADPLVHDRVTPRLVRFMVDNGAHVRALASRWRVPTLLLWAGEDLCTSPAGSEAFAAAVPAGLLHKRCYRKLYHEIFNEPEQGDVLADLTDWLRRF